MAKHVVLTLQREDHAVRASIRDPKRAEEVRDAVLPNPHARGIDRDVLTSLTVSIMDPTRRDGHIYLETDWSDANGPPEAPHVGSKVMAERVAWACADNALQIHGGNGFALEYQISRILCDARILNIFEGAAEIQAQVIARRLLG